MKGKITITEYSVETIRPTKRPGIWAICEPNIIRPLAYLQRPGWVTDKQWERIVTAVRIDAKPGMLNDE